MQIIIQNTTLKIYSPVLKEKRYSFPATLQGMNMNYKFIL